MADREAPLTGEELRETRDDLLERLHGDPLMQSATGAETQRAAEEYLGPILRRVEVDHEDKRTKALAPAAAPARRELGAGAWVGQEDHSPRVPQPVMGEHVTFFTEQLGDLPADGGAPPSSILAPGQRPPLTPRQRLAVECTETMLALPDWAPLVRAAHGSCHKHALTMDRHCLECGQREQALRDLVSRFVRQVLKPQMAAARKVSLACR